MKIPEILLVESQRRPGSLSEILQAIADCGLLVDHLNALRRDQDRTVWEISLELDENVDYGLYEHIEALPNAHFLGKSDRVFNRHRGGKIKMVAKSQIASIQQLRDVYTPGVARVCLAIEKEPAKAWEFTNLASTVGIITNGTAILGLGSIGAVAGLPVMEGKAALYDNFVGLSGVPILLDETDPNKLIEQIIAIAPSFGAIHLEDIAAPTCFDIEDALRAELDKPVLHDDQHGTAVVTLAALMSAMQRVGRKLEESVVGQIGLGAAGIGIARLLLSYGVEKVIGTDKNEDRLERFEAMGDKRTSLDDLMQRADIVIANTGVKGLIKPEMVRPGQVVFALSNPEAEIEPSVALAHGAIFATDGGSVNNALGFPGLFRGALDARAREFTDAMLFAAADTLCEHASGDELTPNPLDKAVHTAVAQAVKAASPSR